MVGLILEKVMLSLTFRHQQWMPYSSMSEVLGSVSPTSIVSVICQSALHHLNSPANSSEHLRFRPLLSFQFLWITRKSANLYGNRRHLGLTSSSRACSDLSIPLGCIAELRWCLDFSLDNGLSSSVSSCLVLKAFPLFIFSGISYNSIYLSSQHVSRS